MASSNDLSKGDEQISEAELAQVRLAPQFDVASFFSLSRNSLTPPTVQISEAFAQVAKGERTAEALESNLSRLEQKIDDLLASFEESERLRVEEANSKRGNPSGERSGNDDEKS